MIDAEKLCGSFREALGWPYASPGGTGKDCSRTGVDCSGLFVRGYRLQGGKIAHGSNAIGRKYVTEAGSIAGTENADYPQENPKTAEELEPGMAVFRWNADTPAKYADGLGDYQHIGLVTEKNPLTIIHASSAAGCVTEDHAVGKWCAWARLKDVDYGDDGSPEEPCSGTFRVKGGALNLRSAPAKDAERIARLPDGTRLTADAADGAWARVTLSGWVMRQYLEADDAGLAD